MALDLVQIGFEVQAKGLDEANQKTDKLIDKFGGVGEAGEKAAARFEKAQERLRSSIQKTEKTVEYMNKGFSSSVASKSAAFKVAGVSDSDIKAFQDSMKALEIAKRNASTASDGFSALNSNLASLSSTAKKTQSSFDSLMSTAGNIAKFSVISTVIYALINSFTSLTSAMVSMADEYTSIQNRMKLYIKDTSELGRVNAQLAQMSIENNVGLRETATLFSRLLPAMQKIGANTAAVTSVVDAFGKSMRIGGATAQEAASATIQFSQAMASGKLAGDEFRSISEASPRFLKAIADGSNIAASKLKEMSAAGMLTTEVISKALLKEYPKLIEENKKLGITLEQGANAIKTGFLVAIGEFNEGAKVTQYFGEMMVDLAQDMLTAAQSARELGQDVKKWFTDNAGTINLVVDAVKLLATTIVARYVASLVLATTASIKLAYSTSAVGTAATVAARNYAIAGAAVLSFGRAAQAAFTFMGGWAGIALTIVGVAASYLLMRDNAAQATSKIAEQSEYINLTTEAYKKLNSEQQKNAQSSLTEDMNKTNNELDLQADAVNRVLLSYAQFKQMQGKALNKETSDVINQTVKGLISYDTAYRKLIDLGVPKNVVEDFKKQKDVYDEAAKAGLKTEAAARAAGLGIKLSGNEAQNASPAIRGLKNYMDALGDASIGAADKFKELVNAYTQGAADIRTSLKVSQQYGLDPSLSDRVVKEAGILVDSHEKIKSQTAAINKQKEAVAKLSTEEQKRYKKYIEQNEKLAKSNRDKLAGQYIAQLAPYAQRLQAAQNERSAFDAAQRKKDKPPKKSDINSFPEQLTLAQEYVKLLNQGVDLDVAKIATTKEYVKWYGTNLDMAKSLVAIDKQRAEIEKQRQEQEQKREAKKQGYKTVIDDLEAMKNKSKFIAEGFLPSVSEKSASLGFTPDAAGIQYAQKATTLELEKQVDAYRNSAIEKRNIFELTKSGKTVEEAQIDNLLYTNKHLLPEQITLLEQIKDLQKEDRREDTRQKVVNDSNTMLRQAAIYSSMQNNDLGDIANSYDMINKSEVQHLNSWKDIIQKVKEYNDYLVNQKANPLGDFSTIDFSAFGDFGNPFESALSGLNLLLGGADALKEKYDQNFAALDQKAKEAAGNEDTLASIKLTRATLEKKQIIDQKNLQQQQVAAALKGVKSLFKEESKGYKALTTLEQVQQGIRIALAIEEAAVKIGLVETTTLATMAANAKQQISDGVTAAISSMKGLPFPYNIAAMGATIAAIAGLGVALSGGGSSGSFAPTNEGTGTVFGDKEAKSESIKKSIDLLADNSRVELPLTAAMLKSLRNIENNIGGLTNLLIRNPPAEGLAASIGQGFKMDGIGKGITGAFDWVNKLTFGLADMFTLGLFSAFGKLLGGAFGKKVSIKGQGLYGGSQDLGGIVTDGFNLQEYVDIQTKKKSFGITTSTKNSTRYSKADQELANQFGLIFKNFYDTILMAASPLDQNLNEVTTKLNNFVVEIGKINLKGLNGEQIQEKLNAVFGAAADNIARAAIEGLDDFQKVGEGYFETLVRVASGIESANAYTSRLNVTAIKYTDIINKQGDITVEIIRQSVLLAEGYKGIAGGFYDMVDAFDGGANELVDFVLQLRDLQDAIYATGKSGDYLTTSMFLGAGGLDRLSNGLEAYFEMLSPAEQAAELTRRLTNEFAIFGLQLPADIKAFRNLVNGIDISTESGQKLYGQVIALAPEFNDLQDSLKNANSAVNDLVKSLRDLAEEARKARGETQQPRNLASIRSEFDATAALAMQGDMTAAQKLLTLGKDLMQVSKQYSVSGSEYAKDLATIQKVATVSADVQELGLGYTPTTSLKPLASAGTQTVETVNSTTDAKLEALRADLITAITAVAKYTQDTAQRLQRWDYGDKMNVHVEQEVGDAPIKVQTV